MHKSPRLKVLTYQAVNRLDTCNTHSGHLGLRGQPWLTTCTHHPQRRGEARARRRRGPAPQRELTDEEKLHQMGYAQELSRRFSRFNNFAISFTIISILSGCLTLYYFGLEHGGPPTMLWGWLLVGAIVILVGLSMAEICSSFPTAGGLYYWAAKLAPGNSAPVWSWFTGWFNLLGQVAVTAGISFGCAFSIWAFLALYTNQALLAVARARHRHPGRRTLHPGPSEHLRHPSRRPAERHLGVVAHPRRAHHPRHPFDRAEVGHSPDRLVPVREPPDGTPSRGSPGSRCRSTSSSSAC